MNPSTKFARFIAAGIALGQGVEMFGPHEWCLAERTEEQCQMPAHIEVNPADSNMPVSGLHTTVYLSTATSTT